MPERLEVLVRGKILTGWRSVQISRALDAASGSFSIEAPSRSPFPMAPGDEVEIFSGSDRLIFGHVDQVERSLDDRARNATVSGRDMTADLVDCTAADEPSEWKNVELEDLVRELAKASGIEVDYTAGTRKPFETFRKRPGDTGWALIERACRLRGVLCYSDGQGRLILRQAGRDISDVELVESLNLKSAVFTSDASERYRLYVVHGQRQGSDGYSDEAVALVEGSATDQGARDGRRLVVIAEATVTNQTAAERAQWEATVRAARAVRVAAGVDGWRQSGKVDDGPLWTINQQIAVRAPSIDLDGYLLVRAVSFTQSGENESTQLELCRPDAFQPQPDLGAEEDIMNDWLKNTGDGELDPDDEPEWEG